jgi:hypothetical protein
VALLLLGILGLAAPAAAAAPESDDVALQELIQILRQKGLIDDDQYMQLQEKADREDAEKKSWLPKLSFWGDIRGRWETFHYGSPPSPARDNRNRLRYRFRLNAKADVNDYVDMFFRLASGDDDDRSTNQTLGSSLDFDSDPIRIDKAYFAISPFGDSEMPGIGGDLRFEFGKVGNPFVWKVGKDFMLWDHDINPEGLSLKFTNDSFDGLDLFANYGYYVIDENSKSKDPYMMAGQLGAEYQIADPFKVGARVSYFHFGSLNEAFVLRGASSAFSANITSGGGNILDGLTGSATGGAADVIETTAYFKAHCDCAEDWPVTFYGSYSRNLDASPGALVGFPVTLPDGTMTTVTTLGSTSDGAAWSAGMEVGDKKRWLKAGFGYWYVGANAFPSMFTDSDLFDGFTNRKGWAVYMSRQIWKNTDLNWTFFMSDPINEGPQYFVSVPNSDRFRSMLDISIKF